MRRSGGQAVRRSALVIGACLLMAGSVHAQDSLPPRPAGRPAPDSLTARPSDRPTAIDTTAPRRPTSPSGAMLRSFLLPGWGQAVYGRKVTAGFMMGVEGLSLGMILKVSGELDHTRAAGGGSESAKLQEREDWITILVFNHLMSGLEAYVAAHLYDFPGDLHLQALPQGGMRLGVTLPLGGR